ncbi:hypothetical protein GBAR_LOCUS27447 [Geodia barretti]|uniref:Uncharacterized protein n=1 Tax=Geodia barretti TaxID=519541 RepID=A0AA35XFS5_GEOBA|nr:hypothetical protein GBAR_LOCUS27447 [Geodia barretti]
MSYAMCHDTYTFSFQDERLCALGTSAQTCLLNGFSNGRVKIFLWELVSIARSMLCTKHFVRLSLTTPLTAEESGLMVTVGVKHFLEIPSDDSLTQPALEELSSTTNSPRQPALEELSSTTNSPRQPALEELSSTTNSPRPLTQPALEELPGTTNSVLDPPVPVGEPLFPLGWLADYPGLQLKRLDLQFNFPEEESNQTSKFDATREALDLFARSAVLSTRPVSHFSAATTASRPSPQFWRAPTSQS